ncbi:unnamed protein product, partial [Brassica oleracea]
MIELIVSGGPDLPKTPPKVYTNLPLSQKALYSAVASDQNEPSIHFSPEVVMQEGVAVVDLPEEVTNDSKPLWESYVVGHFIGDPPHIGKVHATVNRLWTTKEKPSMIDAQFIAPKTALFRIEDKQ